MVGLLVAVNLCFVFALLDFSWRWLITFSWLVVWLFNVVMLIASLHYVFYGLHWLVLNFWFVCFFVLFVGTVCFVIPDFVVLFLICAVLFNLLNLLTLIVGFVYCCVVFWFVFVLNWFVYLVTPVGCLFWNDVGFWLLILWCVDYCVRTWKRLYCCLVVWLVCLLVK